MPSVPESDWKLFRKLQSELTNKACESIFKQVNDIANVRAGKEHQSYLDLYNLIKKEDTRIAEMFNNPTRNNVILKIVTLRKSEVLSNEQLQMFSEQTQEFVNRILNL
ncbi:hypothetical protein WNY51_15600 [Pseudocolwellia sp. AS88]|uniref:hypothetical protein n=1 Tax=Pseudocolwellia sp. AS88 TaxID=3063958 RepID=UPI0026EB9BCD|nr:hypothetical protein [Pseudocolwellia sp. AS88]MDO7083698.1 hypothetical protein [Pseudocolwellia sp. AS88]